MKSVAPKVPCPTCTGTGQIDLPDHLVRTLAVLRKIKRATPPQLKELMSDPIGVTGFNERLDTLLSYGMVARERNGRAWVYRVI